MKVRIRLIPAELFCRNCSRRVTPELGPHDEPGIDLLERTVWCPRCNEHLTCDECGAEIDRRGDCREPTRHQAT